MLLFTACTQDAERQTVDTCSFNAGQSGSCNGLALSFVKIISDSRCPINANCVWEGEATVELAIGDQTLTLSLHAGHPEKSTGKAGDYTVKLLEVSPYPELGKDIPAGAYEIKLEVTK